MSNERLYLIDQGRVSEIDVSDLERVTASERYTREWICAYTELYDRNLLAPDNTVIDGETHGVLTLPRIRARRFETIE
jgi:hypothetical protein